jgi:hypothetical protein
MTAFNSPMGALSNQGDASKRNENMAHGPNACGWQFAKRLVKRTTKQMLGTEQPAAVAGLLAHRMHCSRQTASPIAPLALRFGEGEPGHSASRHTDREREAILTVEFEHLSPAISFEHVHRFGQS